VGVDEKGKVTQVKINDFIPGVAPFIPFNSTVTCYGKRRSGKSVFIRWFMHEALREYVPWFYVFTKTKHNRFFEGFMPEKFILPIFNDEILEMIMERQKKAMKIYNSQDPDEGDDVLNPRLCLIWDDYNGKSITYSERLKDFYWTGRHFQVMNIFCAQYVKLTPPGVRTNTDYVVLFNTDSYDNLKQFHEDFAGKMDFYAFVRMFRENIEKNPFSFLVIDNDPNVSYDQKFYWGMADKLPFDLDHILGCESFWRDSKEQLYDIGSGKMEKIIERISKVSKKEADIDQRIKKNQKNGVLDMADRESPTWDTGDYNVELRGKKRRPPP